jgi:hypothetical protein
MVGDAFGFTLYFDYPNFSLKKNKAKKK